MSRVCFSSAIRLRTPSRIETSSIEIGSSASTTSGSTASARAIATRCRWPPESSCGYFAATTSGGHEPDRLEQLERPLADAVAPGRSRGSASGRSM